MDLNFKKPIIYTILYVKYISIKTLSPLPTTEASSENSLSRSWHTELFRGHCSLHRLLDVFIYYDSFWQMAVNSLKNVVIFLMLPQVTFRPALVQRAASPV